MFVVKNEKGEFLTVDENLETAWTSDPNEAVESDTLQEAKEFAQDAPTPYKEIVFWN